jgi:hypothetical protein
MGVECGDEEGQTAFFARHVHADILRAAEIIKRHRVLLVTQNLIGCPSRKAIRRT